MMTERPIAIDDSVRSAVSRGAVVAMSLSGGKDSTAAAFEANAALDAAGHPPQRRIAVHADLGRAEWQQTPATVEQIAATLGLPLFVVRHARHDMVSRWQDRFDRGLARYANLETLCLIGPWSTPALRFCQSEMKAQVITRFLRDRFAGEEIISVIGIRRDESHGRRNAVISKADTRLDDARGTQGLIWHPLIEWTSQDVFALHQRAGLPLHDAYTVYGSTRLSCGFCIMSSAPDLAASATCTGNTALLHMLVDLEARSTFSFQAARWLADVTPTLLSAGQQQAIARAKTRADQRRSLEGSLPAGLRYVKGWPLRVPTHDEAEHLADVRNAVAGHHDLDTPYRTPAAIRDRFAELVASRPH